MNVAIAILLTLNLVPATKPARHPAARTKPELAILLPASWENIRENVVSPPADAQQRAVLVNADPLSIPIKSLILRCNPRLPDETANSIAYWVLHYGETFKVPPALVAALIARESSFNPEAVSPTGAQGLGQLSAATAKELGVANALDPEENIRATAQYLGQLLTMWKGRPDQIECAVASYLVGPRVVCASNGVPNAESVQKFVSDVMAGYNSLTPQAQR